jgi:cellulose 1,4-beta-cellobiosidase
VAVKSPFSLDTVVRQEDGTPYPISVIPYEGMIVKNGGTGTVAVKLPVQPSQNVTVKTTVIDGGGKLTVSSGASLTFTPGNFNTPQNVTLQSTASQAGWERIIIAPAGTDIPGYNPVQLHVLVS